MASAGRPRGFGSDPPTGSGRAGLGGHHKRPTCPHYYGNHYGLCR